MRIRIQCTEKITFDQIVEISAEDWQELSNTKCSRMEDGQMSPLTQHLDLTDICGSEDFDDIDIFEVDQEGKRIEDGAEWDPYAVK